MAEMLMVTILFRVVVEASIAAVAAVLFVLLVALLQPLAVVAALGPGV
jgi:hypothetical protein